MAPLKTYPKALIAIAGFVLAAGIATKAFSQASAPTVIKNVVFVHGAWADGSSWSKVIPRPGRSEQRYPPLPGRPSRRGS
jgi:hypothetical protein